MHIVHGVIFFASMDDAEGENMPQTHSHLTPAGRAVWHTERLWQLVQDLPVRAIALSAIPEFDQDCWFRPHTPPTCRAVAQHARRIWDADLTYPIILSADGKLMDGGHRIAKAWLLGLATIEAVQFVVDPEPDYVLPE
jgi:hypothetical protein